MSPLFLQHNGETFDCFICKKKFYANFLLLMHQRQVHEGKLPLGRQKQPCKICGINIVGYRMKKHMEIHGGLHIIVELDILESSRAAKEDKLIDRKLTVTFFL